MGLYTEKSYREMVNPLINYAGDKDLVKSQIYAMGKGDSDMYKYRNNLQDYNRAIEAGKKNDSDNFFTGIGDFLFGRGTDALRADLSDEYTKAYAANPYEFSGKQYNEDINRTKSEQDFDKGTVFSGGLIGGLLNPITQTAKAGIDLGRGVVGSIAGDQNAWDAWGKRDWLSDLGALGETALTVVPTVRGLTGAGKAAATGAKTLGKTIGKGAAMGAGYGLSGGLREMGGKDFDLGQLLTGTAVGAGVGGALSGAGYGLGKAWNKYSQPAPSKSTDLVKYGGGSATTSPQLQEYMNTLGVTGDNLTEEGLKSARNQATKNIAKTVGYESTEGQAQRTAINNAYQELLKNLEGKGTAAAQTAQYVAPKTSFAQKLKNVGSNIPTMGRDIKSSKLGRATTKALSTKRGKVAAGVGGGLLLSQLLSNKGQSQPTQQELDELYNYIYGG